MGGRNLFFCFYWDGWVYDGVLFPSTSFSKWIDFSFLYFASLLLEVKYRVNFAFPFFPFFHPSTFLPADK